MRKKEIFSFLSAWIKKWEEALMVGVGIITIIAALVAGITAIEGIYAITKISLIVLGLGAVIIMTLAGRATILLRRTCKYINQNCEKAMKKYKKRMASLSDEINK